jgi:hypothetical protein
MHRHLLGKLALGDVGASAQGRIQDSRMGADGGERVQRERIMGSRRPASKRVPEAKPLVGSGTQGALPPEAESFGFFRILTSG